MASVEETKSLQGLGQRIRKLREQHGWTQEEFGQKCGLHRTFIGSVERGERNVSILNLRHMARMLRVPLTDLLG